MIQLTDVFFEYKKNQPILKGVKYQFENGSKYVIRGNNGSGKTTLLRLLCGLLNVTSGSIVYPAHQTISFLPDNNGLYENMTILENINFRISLYKLSYENLMSDVRQLLLTYDLRTHQDTLVSDLSLGMKKKVALICSYVVQPDIFILDEPTGGIDNHSKAELIAMLTAVDRKEMLTIVTSHDEDFIESMKAKIIFIQDGMLRDGSTH